MIKLIVFDLDGVLIDTCEKHYEILNKAIEEIAGKEYIIDRDEHNKYYNGHSTREKLKRLSQEKNLAEEYIDLIYNLKQKLTIEELDKISFCEQKKTDLLRLKEEGYKLYCATNTIRNSLNKIVSKLDLNELFDLTLSNEDVIKPKPAGDIYLECIKRAGVSCKETLIVEDSYTGISSARKTNANICIVKNAEETTYERIKQSICYYESANYSLLEKTMFEKKINIVIPMAGNGSRFANLGYKDPKPFISVFEKPMISWVINNMKIDANYIFIVKEQHCETYNVEVLLKCMVPECKIIKIRDTTEGAACTVLLAEEMINNENPLIIVNSDQWIEWDIEKFLFDFLIRDITHSVKISTFYAKDSPKWSYAQVNKDGYVVDVKEKEPISTHATTGVYAWRSGRDFVKYAKKMISENKRTRGEFYVAPVIKEAIDDGHLVSIDDVKEFWSLGVPEDLEYFLANKKMY